MRARREAWLALQPDLGPARLMFLDETGATTKRAGPTQIWQEPAPRCAGGENPPRTEFDPYHPPSRSRRQTDRPSPIESGPRVQAVANLNMAGWTVHAGRRRRKFAEAAWRAATSDRTPVPDPRWCSTCRSGSRPLGGARRAGGSRSRAAAAAGRRGPCCGR